MHNSRIFKNKKGNSDKLGESNGKIFLFQKYEFETNGKKFRIKLEKKLAKRIKLVQFCAYYNGKVYLHTTYVTV